jgi:hypothetical protein
MIQYRQAGAHKFGSSLEAMLPILAAFGNIIHCSGFERPILRVRVTIGRGDVVHAIAPVILLEIIQIKGRGTDLVW